MCCFDDLRPYLEVLSNEECVPLQEKFRIVSEASWDLVRPVHASSRAFLTRLLSIVSAGNATTHQRTQSRSSTDC